MQELKATDHILVLDPNDQFPNADPLRLIEAGGLLTEWALAYFGGEKAAPTLREHMRECYCMGELYHPPKGEAMKMTFHPDSHLSYPGDPDLHPLFSIEQPEPSDPPLRFICYQYGIVALIENGETFITRMD